MVVAEKQLELVKVQRISAHLYHTPRPKAQGPIMKKDRKTVIVGDYGGSEQNHIFWTRQGFRTHELTVTMDTGT